MSETANAMTAISRPWKPLLTGKKSDNIVATVDSISRDLSQTSKAWLPHFGTKQDKDIIKVSLSNGFAGLSLYFGYVSKSHDERKQTRGLLLIRQAIDEMGSMPLDPSLFRGFSGIAWAMTHLQSLFRTETSSDLCAVIDTALLGLLGKPRLDLSYELVEGLVGIGVYFLERLPRQSAKVGLELVVKRLMEKAIRQEDTVLWYTDRKFFSPAMQGQFAGGCYNLGMAHGVAGLISLLSMIYARGIAVTDIRPLLDGTVCWVMRQEGEQTIGPHYPSWVTPEGTRRGGRYAWCYGDMPIVFSLLHAGRSLGNDLWISKALNTARRIAEETLGGSAYKWIADPFFCHGSCGMAHMFNRLYQATDDALFRRSAIRWVEKTLEQRKEGQGIGGYISVYPNEPGNNYWPQNPGILNGASGIGLALLAATSNVAPLWDRMLMLDLPPQSF